MTAFVLIPGAGGAASYWSRVVPLLEQAGHETIAVDLPGPDPETGLHDYAGIVVAAARPFTRVVLAAQSMGGFTAPLAAERLSIEELVLVNAMVPIPGETAGEWWDATGAVQAREDAAREGGYGAFDVATYFLHDVDPTGLPDTAQDENDAAFGTPCNFNSWPDRVRVLSGADDRFFPAPFQRRVARERLDIEPDVLPGGHLMAMSQPEAVAAYLLDLSGS